MECSYESLTLVRRTLPEAALLLLLVASTLVMPDPRIVQQFCCGGSVLWEPANHFVQEDEEETSVLGVGSIRGQIGKVFPRRLPPQHTIFPIFRLAYRSC